MILTAPQLPCTSWVHDPSDPVSNEGLATTFVAVGAQALDEAELIVAGVEVGVKVAVGVVVSTLEEELGFSKLAEVETDVELELEGVVVVLMVLWTQDVTSAPICLGASEMLGTKPDGQAKTDELVDNVELD